MRIGLSCAAFYGQCETEDAAALVRDYPAEAAEVFVQTPSEYCGAFGRVVREKLGALPCSSIHPLGTQFEQQLFGRSARQVEDAFRLFTGVCDAGREMGAQYYVFHGPFGVHAPLKPERIHRLPEVFARMQQIAHERGLTVLWENVHWCALRGPQEVRTMIRLLPEVQFVLDTKQAHRAGFTPEEMLDAMGDRVRHVHALDVAADGTLCLPPEGVIDWPDLMRRLRLQGFDGTVVLEPYEYLARDGAALSASLQNLRAAAQQSGG
ncbi:MAG: sugar phosphate isomerase/epimerase [Clostridia bacterium]|nr:sugar phosphate isomerase/epimerase [Clostridia bacterium]